MSTTLFYMWRGSRQHFIERHRFYVEQSKKRLLSQFKNIEQDADSYAEECLIKRGQNFNPDRDDPSSIEEQAYDESIGFYLMLDEMRMNTQLSVVAGMFHMWDKELRDWLTKEIIHWHRGSEVRNAVWKETFDNVMELLENLNWNIKSQPFYSKLDGLRWVVNAYKHGAGLAFETIKGKFPQYLDEFTDGMVSYAHFTNLHVTEEQIDDFSEAIINFWEFIPERTFANDSMDLPKWFEKAYDKDCVSAQP